MSVEESQKHNAGSTVESPEAEMIKVLARYGPAIVEEMCQRGLSGEQQLLLRSFEAIMALFGNGLSSKEKLPSNVSTSPEFDPFAQAARAYHKDTGDRVKTRAEAMADAEVKAARTAGK